MLNYVNKSWPLLGLKPASIRRVPESVRVKKRFPQLHSYKPAWSTLSTQVSVQNASSWGRVVPFGDGRKIFMTSFSQFRELELHPALHSALDKMNFLNPTPIQEATIPAALNGQDILGCAQTGTGKTGAFGIPLIQYLLQNPERKALILAPTRELADQIHRNLTLMAADSPSLRIALIIGGASMQQQIKNLGFGARIIVATPGRLIDLLQQKCARLSAVGILVLDEVDRMLDMGFAPQLEQIVPHLPKERQTLLFSATLPREILKLTDSYLKNPLRVSVGEQSAPAQNVEQEMISTEQGAKNELLIRELQERNGKTIVFVRTQHGTERLAKLVRKAGFLADRLHGGRTQGQRKRALEQFRSGETQVLLATDIAGRGIDIDDIEFVINFDMPKTHEDYIHRIGRTGRYGRSGIAINFVTADDTRLMRLINPEAFPRGGSAGRTQHPNQREPKPSRPQGSRNQRPPRQEQQRQPRQEQQRPPRGERQQNRERGRKPNHAEEGRSTQERPFKKDLNNFKKRPPVAEGRPIIIRADEASQDEKPTKKKSVLARIFNWE